MPIPSEERAQLARQVLVDILKQNGPQLGARLKLQLTAALGQRLARARAATLGLLGGQLGPRSRLAPRRPR